MEDPESSEEIKKGRHTKRKGGSLESEKLEHNTQENRKREEGAEEKEAVYRR